MKRLVLLIFFFFFLFSQKAFAATLSIQNTPFSVNQSDEFSVDVSLSCPGCSDSYLRGVFYDSGTSYFGYTQDSSGSFNNAPGSNCTTFFKVAQSDLASGSWSGKIKFKPDSSSAYFKGSGEYSFKVGRYTSSCSSPSVWSQDVLISIIGPTSTPTSIPSAAPTFSPTRIPTLYQTPSFGSVQPTSKASVKSASTESKLKNKSSTLSAKEVFNVSTPSPAEESLVSGINESNSRKNRFVLLFTLSVGAILFIIAACILIKRYFNQIKEWINS